MYIYLGRSYVFLENVNIMYLLKNNYKSSGSLVEKRFEFYFYGRLQVKFRSAPRSIFAYMQIKFNYL